MDATGARIARIVAHARRALGGAALAALVAGGALSALPAGDGDYDIRSEDLDFDGSADYVLYGDPNPFDPPAGDGDGLYDDGETGVYGTDPAAWDTDGDGASDGEEVYYGTDPRA